jgi:hypothetical protein
MLNPYSHLLPPWVRKGCDRIASAVRRRDDIKAIDTTSNWAQKTCAVTFELLDGTRGHVEFRGDSFRLTLNPIRGERVSASGSAETVIGLIDSVLRASPRRGDPP